MAELTAARNNALPYPVYGLPWVVAFPLLDADGDPITPSSPDSEVSKNCDTFADCTNEAVEIATSSGSCYLILTGAEMTADIVAVQIKSTGAKTTVITLYPRKLVVLASGTCQGSNDTGDIQLASGEPAVNDYYNGCLVVATIDTVVECRIINDYVGSTKVAEISPAWVTAQPDSNDTYTIYLPEGRQIAQADLTAAAAIAYTSGAIPAAVAGASGGIFIAGSNAATTISGLTTGALACTTITASGAVAFQSTFAVTTSTALAALSCSTLTASGAVAFQSTFVVSGTTTFAAINTGAIAATTFATSGTMTLNALTVSNNALISGTLTVTGTTTLTGAVSLGSTLGITGTTTLAALATGAITCSTIAASGTVTFNAFTVTNALTVSGTTTLTGAVSLGSTLGVTGTTTLAALATGAITASTLATSGTVTLNALTVSNVLTVSGATTLTGAVTATSASNDIRGAKLAASGLDLVIPADPVATEPSFAGSSSIVAWIAFFGAWSVNKVTSDADSVNLRNTADNADLIAHATSDSGTTFTSGAGA